MSRSSVWKCTTSQIRTAISILRSYRIGLIPPRESAPSDDELLKAAADGIAQLNRRYGPAQGGPRFYLLHRQRMWNEGQGKWIGWERKRGKLHELNRWLRGANDTTFIAINGALPLAPPEVRYVITLDADTRLPRGTAKRLVGKMAHPLNRPRLDPVKRPRGGRIRGVAAASHALAAEKLRGIVVSARVYDSERTGSVRLRCI